MKQPAGTGQLFDGDVERVCAIVEEASRDYFQSRRERVGEFIDRHFCFTGSARLHRRAMGWDVLKAPANLFLAAPNAAVKLSAAMALSFRARRAADFLNSRKIMLDTAVGREVEWLIMTELLELPFSDGKRLFEKDVMAEFILGHPEVSAEFEHYFQALNTNGRDAGYKQRLNQAVSAYSGTRSAATDISTNLITVGAGAAAFKTLTPGTVSLSATLTAALAHQAAVASFPLGATLGGIWYSIFAVSVSPILIAGTAVGLTAFAGLTAAFANVAADPVQRRLGLHRRRLLKLIDTLEMQFRDEDARFMARDHYVAKLLDFGDILASVYRLTRP